MCFGFLGRFFFFGFFVSHRVTLPLLVNAGFGVRVALDADGLARAFARARVRRGALAANWQAAQVANASVAFDALETLEVQAQFAAEVAFDDVFAVLDGVDDLRELLLIQILGPNAAVDFCFLEDVERVRRPDAVDVAQSDVDSLFAGNFNTNNACHN